MATAATHAKLATVVIAVRNGQAHILEAVESALAQGPLLEQAIVVDDRSTDATLQRLSGVAHRRLTVIANDGEGVSSARNAGAAATHSPWLLFLDADDRLAPGALEALVAGTQPGAVGTYGDYERVDGEGRPFGRRHLIRTSRPKPSGEILEPMLAGNLFINGGVFLCDRAAFERVGGFDRRFALCEDWHLWCRLAALGPISYTPKHVLDYRVHPASVMMRKRRTYRDFHPALQAIFTDQTVRARVAPERLARLQRSGEASLMTYCAQQALRAGDYGEVSNSAFAAIAHFPEKTPWILGRLAGAWASL